MEKHETKGFTTHHYQPRETEELLNVIKFFELYCLPTMVYLELSENNTIILIVKM